MNSSTSSFSLPTWPHYSEEEINEVASVLRRGKGNYWFGEQGRCFEEEFAGYCKVSFGLAVANGTLALELALHGLGLGEGDEVLVTPRSFVASANCIVLAGGRPVFVDVDPVSQNITAEAVARSITKKTRAIIAVHLGGWPCEMEEIMRVAKERNLYVIEDCAQAHGAEYKGQKVGAIGHVAAFSFCHDKIISTGGEGGMLVTNDESIWGRAAAMRNHGKDPRKYNPGILGTRNNGEADTFGSNHRMTEMQSCIGRVQLKNVESWLETRRRNAGILDDMLSRFSAVRRVIPPAHLRHAYYQYYFFVEKDKLSDGWDRSRIIAEIYDRGIPCSAGSTAEIYELESFSGGEFAVAEHLTVARQLGSSSVMLPVPHVYDEKCMQFICEAVDEVLQNASQ